MLNLSLPETGEGNSLLLALELCLNGPGGQHKNAAGQRNRAEYPRMSLQVVQSSGRVGHLKLLMEKMPINSASVRVVIYVAIH